MPTPSNRGFGGELEVSETDDERDEGDQEVGLSSSSSSSAVKKLSFVSAGVDGEEERPLYASSYLARFTSLFAQARGARSGAVR